MRIGIIAPPWIPVPPPAYGGIESVVALQARVLASAGHDVTLVAAPGSWVPGVRVVTPPGGRPRPRIGDPRDEHVHVTAALRVLAGHDVVVDHCGTPASALRVGSDHPAPLHVLHGKLTDGIAGVYDEVARAAPRLRFVAISAAQASHAPGLPYAGVCHNAVDVDAVPFSGSHRGYLAFVGRASPEKGLAEAIAIARRAGMPLRVAAKCREPEEHEYFRRHVAPALGDGVLWLGEVGGREKHALLAGAAALLFPIAWEEPFGMVMIEAMAAGAPVLATPRGSVPEVVEDGVTGLVRDDVDALAAAVPRALRLSRPACRSHVRRRFSADSLCRAYEDAIAWTARRSRQGAT